MGKAGNKAGTAKSSGAKSRGNAGKARKAGSTGRARSNAGKPKADAGRSERSADKARVGTDRSGRKADKVRSNLDSKGQVAQRIESVKEAWKPGNMLYPLPAVMVSVGDKAGHQNILTVAWTGTICTNPAMLYISVRPERYSYGMIKETGEFVVNLTTEKLAKETDYCGVRSGRDVDKWKETGLTPGKTQNLSYAPLIQECPVNIECRVTEVKELGSHHMFLAEVLAVNVDSAYMNEKNKFELNKTGLLAYSHGEYLGLGKNLGTFGYSVRKKKRK